VNLEQLLEGLVLEAPSAVDVLCRGLRREVERTGFDRVILGLSGGLDSALTAHLAVRAFGADRVICVAMPYRKSNPDSLGHARVVAGQLSIELRVEDISPQVDTYFAAHQDANSSRRGNKMARERMTILYDLSAAESAMVLGTSNKTELLLGYSTIFGDSASAVNPIGDLYKTQVRQISRQLEVAPEVLAKAPSADLWEGQTDEDELGFSYEKVDAFLSLLVDRRQRPAQLIEEGFEPEFVERVRGLIQRSQYKRKMPVIIKISGRTVDKDFLYPRDWTG